MTGKNLWHATVIDKMLSNEKYMGDALLQKTYTVDFLSKKKVINKGIVPQYYIEGNHEAIIPKELFYKVQEEKARRANVVIPTDGTIEETAALIPPLYAAELAKEGSHGKHTTSQTK